MRDVRGTLVKYERRQYSNAALSCIDSTIVLATFAKFRTQIFNPYGPSPSNGTGHVLCAMLINYRRRID